MKNADFAFAKAIKINNKADMYYEYIKWHEKQHTHIPDRIASFVIDKSLQLSDVAIHTRLLRLVSQNVIHSIYPGLFTYYLNNYNKETEKCMLILLESFRPIPKDLQLRLYLFYTQNKYFNKEIYTLLSKTMNTEYRTYFCERLLCKCGTCDEEYVKQKLESILIKRIEDKHVESICIDSLMVQKDHKDLNTKNYTYVLQEKEKRILSYALQHKHLAVPKNQCLQMVKVCFSQNMEIEESMHTYLFSNSFDLIKILSCSLDFVNYYLDNFDKYADAAYETRIAELFIVYLAKYDTNIVDTTFGKNLLANKDLSPVLDNCYDFVTKNLQNFNDKNNFTMLTIFYNLLQIKYLPETKQILNNIFEVIYTQTDADKIAKYLYFINKIVELNVLSRKHLKYIYKQLVYYDNDDYRVRCYIYQILGSIIKDYSSLDTRIESILRKSDEKTHLLRTCDITEERIGLYDIQSYNKNNAKVLAAMVWFDLGCSKSKLEYPHICKLLAVIIECTGTFYERRIIRSGLLNRLFIKHNQIVNGGDDDSGPFLHLLAAVNANFNLSAKDRKMFANTLANCKTSNIALEKFIQDLHLTSE